MFRRTRRRRNALRELLHPRHLHLRKIRTVGHDNSRHLIDGAQRQVTLIPMDNIVVIVVVVVIVILVDSGDFAGEVMQAQVIVIVEPRIVVGKTVSQIQSRHRYGDARVRRPHALKRRQVV